MTNLQAGIVMGFGALIAVAGLWLLYTRNDAGANRFKILGQEFEISTPALVVFLVGSAIFVLPFFLPRLHEPAAVTPRATTPGNSSSSFTEEKEPNDSFSSATPIGLTTPVKGRIAVTDDRDIFVFRTSSGSQPVLRIHVKNNSMTLRPSLLIYNGSKARVKRIYNHTEGADLELSGLPARADSTFYAEVTPIYPSVGDYELKVTAE